jgi:transcriptional regulator with XRE-family HTH domain
VSRDGASRTLGTVLRTVREQRGQTRERLAVDAGLSVGTLARMELGHSDPTWSTILAVAHALRLPLAELGGLVDNARKASSAPKDGDA